MRATLPAAILLLGATACSPSSDSVGSGGGNGSGGEGPTGPGSGGGATVGTGASTSSAGGGASTSSSGGGGAGGGSSSSSSSGGGGGGPCPEGVTCVSSFPFSEERDTSLEGSEALSAYAPCAPDTDEGGPEIVYRVTAPTDGFLSVAAYDAAGVDIDVHILTDFDPAAPSSTTCVARGDKQASADVPAGNVWIVADTYVSGGEPQTGPFRIDIGFISPSEGDCGMQVGEMQRVGDGGDALAMPATGPIVMEAHLVTQDEPAPFPTTNTEELEEHYALSQAETGLVMFREQVWAPLEGGSFYGAGIGDPADFPVEHEGWYVNMYWTPASRPPKGTRMILRHPEDPTRAVVVAAGYETGPGDLSSVGGTPEETHFYLGTSHGSTLTLGIAEDPSLPLGPRRCTD